MHEISISETGWPNIWQRCASEILEHRLNEATSIFGDRDAGGIVLPKSFNEYYHGW